MWHPGFEPYPLWWKDRGHRTAVCWGAEKWGDRGVMGVTPKSSTTHGDLGIPHFEKPTSDRTLDFHWTFQVQENRSTWTGWNAISTCNWAKYGANNDSRFLMVVYPRQHQLRQLRCTWFSRRAKDELDVDFVSKPGFATLHINGRIRILSFPVFLGLTRQTLPCGKPVTMWAKIDNHDQQRQRWKPAKGGPPDSPVCRPNLRMRSYVYIYIHTHTVLQLETHFFRVSRC